MLDQDFILKAEPLCLEPFKLNHGYQSGNFHENTLIQVILVKLELMTLSPFNNIITIVSMIAMITVQYEH